MFLNFLTPTGVMFSIKVYKYRYFIQILTLMGKIFKSLLFLSSIARHIQKHMRLFNVIESMDNGKTIRETRDADIPIVVRHFYHHAGWAQLMETEMRGWESVGIKQIIL